MVDDIRLNVPLLRRRVPNLTVAARNVGLRPATVSDLCNGKIHLGRAEVRTLVLLAELANCTLDELVIRNGGMEMIETGIKVLDLFAPLVRGGSAGLVARTNMGQMVLLQELLTRLRQKGFATVIWLPAEADPIMEKISASAEFIERRLDDVQLRIEQLRQERDVFVGTDRSLVISGELDALRERLDASAHPPVTFALVDALGESPDEDVPYGPLETLWQFDIDLVARHFLPAVNPVASTSTILESGYLDSTHLTVQQRARKLLRRYRELHALARVRGEDQLPTSEMQTFQRGKRLEAFLSQPFYVAEPYTNRAGEWVSLQETIDGVRRILDGAGDDMDVESLKYIGALSSL